MADRMNQFPELFLSLYFSIRYYWTLNHFFTMRYSDQIFQFSYQCNYQYLLKHAEIIIVSRFVIYGLYLNEEWFRWDAFCSFYTSVFCLFVLRFYTNNKHIVWMSTKSYFANRFKRTNWLLNPAMKSILMTSLFGIYIEMKN